MKNSPPTSVERRKFLGQVAAGSAGFLLAGCGKGNRTSRADGPGAGNSGPGTERATSEEIQRFLQEFSKTTSTGKLRILSENTPPSVASRRLALAEFQQLTGIELEWELKPLEDVRARMLVDFAQKRGNYDLVYVDQSWLGEQSPHLVRLDDWIEKQSLAIPDWDPDDFLRPLVEATASYRGEKIGVPYDITLFIGFLRKDIFSKMGLKRPVSLEEWLAAARQISQRYLPGMYGTTSQWKVGHYSLLCSMSSWLWAHGGSFFHADGSPAVNDDAGLAALEYMLELQGAMSPGVITWDWHGEAESFARGEVGFYGSWAEFLPQFEDPERSRIAGKVQTFPLEFGGQVRAPEDCSFGETPGFSHQGGSCFSLSRYSGHKEAAWVFLQWLTSRDIQVRACVLGGGALATRRSTFTDSRIYKAGAPTRHLPVMLEAIENRMGTEPHHPDWPKVAMQALPVQLGKMITGQQNAKTTADSMARVLQNLRA